MQFDQRTVNPRAARVNRELERVANGVVRSLDHVKERLHLGGRAAKYDDVHYEFVGGARDALRKKHYDKSLRLLWKAEMAAPWSSFHDAGQHESELIDLAEKSMTGEERAIRERITSADFKALLDRQYTLEQKRAIVSVLSAIGARPGPVRLSA